MNLFILDDLFDKIKEIVQKVYNFLFKYNKKKFTVLIVLQFIGTIILSIKLELKEEYISDFLYDIINHSNWDVCAFLGVITAIIVGIFVGGYNGFFINLIPHVIDLLENSASSLKTLKEKSESNNTDNTDNT